MNTQHIYHVIAATPGCWKVITEGAEPTFHSTEGEAVAAAREWAMINEPSHVVIHKADGSVEEEYMMKMDSFPHAPAASSEMAIDGEQQMRARPSRPSKRPSQRQRGSGNSFPGGNATL